MAIGLKPGGITHTRDTLLHERQGGSHPVGAHRPTLGNLDADKLTPIALMYAAHFAVGLAISSRAPRAPIGALLAGCFLPDIVWIVLATSGIEPSSPRVFFDDWSHSLLSIVVEASLFSLLFIRRGVDVWVPIWLAVALHFLLDVLIHPKPLALYPLAAWHAPWDLWIWGSSRTSFLFTHYWWVQFGIIVPLILIYIIGARKQALPANLVAATVLSVLGLHLLF